MPQFTNDELQIRAASGAIVAISVDTTIFDRYGCNLDYVALQRLDQFKDSHVDVLLSEIVVSEIAAHIERDAVKSQRELRNALIAHNKRWKLTPDAGAPQAYELQSNPKEEAEKQVSDYVAAIGADIVPAARSVTVAEKAVQKYFDVEAPFEPTEKKKNEFPDAFALLSLEEVAAEAGQLILCVSADGGWRDFAAASEHLVCIDDLDAALALFNEAGRAVADHALGLLRAGTAPNIQASVEGAFEYRLDDNDFEIEAHGSTEFEAEANGAVLQWVDWKNSEEPSVIAEDADSVTFTVKATALVSFEANVSYMVWDSVDKEYVELGTEEESVEEKADFEIALTVSRELEAEPEVIEATVAKQRLSVSFGYLEPFRNENPEHEKY